jgi:hypothetical protein
MPLRQPGPEAETRWQANIVANQLRGPRAATFPRRSPRGYVMLSRHGCRAGTSRLRRGGRGALRERPIEAQPFPEVDGVELERPAASWNSRSTSAFVWSPRERSSMVRADAHFPRSHCARKPLMSSKEGQALGARAGSEGALSGPRRSSLAGGQVGRKTSGSSSGSSMDRRAGAGTLPSLPLAWESL